MFTLLQMYGTRCENGQICAKCMIYWFDKITLKCYNLPKIYVYKKENSDEPPLRRFLLLLQLLLLFQRVIALCAAVL